MFTETPKVMSLADPDQKMSKSLGPRHYIGLFEEEQSIREKIKAAVTDSGDLPPGTEMSPGVANLIEILKACGKHAEASSLVSDYNSGKLQYRELKEVVTTALVELTGRLRQRRDEILSDETAAKVKLLEMTEKARELARENIRKVRAVVGLPVRY